jgi:ribosomal protein S18 acetylase RimI-like enzyme
VNGLAESLFANPVWHALHTKHRRFGVFSGDACRYRADVVPFAAVASPAAGPMQQLRSLLAPGESVWLIGEHYPETPELICEGTLECLQMVMQEEVVMPAAPTFDIVRLSEANAPEMLALTDLAFPGFFRKRTCEMGAYYGVRSSEGELIAMGGERLQLDEFSEISGLCTHPSFRGHGFAANLIWRLIRDHRREGRTSWLHVGCENKRAIELYLRMGFVAVRKVRLHRIFRKSVLSAETFLTS